MVIKTEGLISLLVLVVAVVRVISVTLISLNLKVILVTFFIVVIVGLLMGMDYIDFLFIFFYLLTVIVHVTI